jgi:hypothetical protein
MHMRKATGEGADKAQSVHPSEAPLSDTGRDARPIEDVDGSRRQVLHLGALAALALTGCGTASNGGNGGSQTGSAGGQTGSTGGQTGSTGGQTGSTGSSAGAQTGSAEGGSGVSGGTTAEGGSGASGSGAMGDSGMMTGPGWQEANCTPVTTLPVGTMGPSQPMCPNPFLFMDGSTISSKADWECLRADLSAMLQAAVYGPKMPPPDTLTATMSGGTVTVNCKVGTKTGSFTFTITGGNTSTPTAGVVRIASSGNPFPSNVATINFDEHQFAQENQMWPTTGLVTTLYGNTAAGSGSDICWAWGASRIIDALIQLGPAATGINWKQLAVTGCSFAGKGAFACGAFDERFILVAPEEAGTGGASLWRVSSAEAALGQNIQEATEIVGEQNWQGKAFHDLFAGKSKTNAPVGMLIADQHFLVALCAPRACLIIDNDIDWLGPLATYAGGVIGKKVYTALGITDRCEVNVSAEHAHCSFPSSQQADLTAFINRYLLGMTSTTVAATDVLNDTHSTIKTYTESQWIDWTAPTLSGSLSWDPFA